MSRGRVVVETLDSRVLEGNRPGDSTVRHIPVYLPPSYDDTRRYPAIYMLAGFSGTGLSFLNYQCFAPTLPQRIDSAISSGRMKPAIVVMADGMTRYGGSQYLDSSATGPYQTFLAEETVAFVDARYRTIPKREARAVVGKSSGGYGALVAAMQRADVFGACACHAGDIYFEYCYGPDIPKAASAIVPHHSLHAWLAHFEALPRKRGSDFTAISIAAMASAYSPNEDADGPGFDLPFDLETGARREDVWARWLTHDPLRLLERHSDDLRKLSLLHVDVGSSDEYNLHLGARIFRKRLQELDIAHRYEEFKDGHRDTAYRYDVSLPAIREALAGD